jgi:hypothetical protein
LGDRNPVPWQTVQDFVVTVVALECSGPPCSNFLLFLFAIFSATLPFPLHFQQTGPADAACKDELQPGASLSNEFGPCGTYLSIGVIGIDYYGWLQ